MNTIKKRIDEIKIKLHQWSHAYYVLDKPLVDDSEYDLLLNELILIEKENPNLITTDSPTQKVGGIVLEKFEKYQHKTPMLSLANAFNENDLQNFNDQIFKETENNNYSFFVEPKIDGLSISLIYSEGILIRAITRGDGVFGEDVTTNVKTIRSIPLKISNEAEYCEIRGEVFLSKKEFDKINHQRSLNGEELFANPRNAAAGTLRQLDSNIASSRKLDAFLYYYMDRQYLTTHSDSMKYLSTMNFKINSLGKKCKNIEEVIAHIEYISKQRNELDYEIDGVVIKIDEFDLYEKVGYTSKFPKWAIAYKFPAEIKSTKLLNIFPSVGRTGRITYNAVLEPVQLAGTIVQAATLHNADFIIDRDIRIGSLVKVKKAGDIIPEVIEPIKDEFFLTLNKFKEAITCPDCNSNLERFEDEVDQYCTNVKCSRKIIRSIEHFVSRDAMNIEGLSIKIIEKLFFNNFIKDIKDIYNLNQVKTDLIQLDKMGEKSVENLLTAIEKSKSNSAEKLFFGLGIRHVGKKTAQLLITKYKNILDLKKINWDELEEIHDIGPTVTQSIKKWFSEKTNIKLLEILEAQGVNLKYLGEIGTKFDKNISNKNFVITGTLSKPRNYFKEILETFGAKVIDSVSKKTDYLLAGNDAGSKMEKAQKLNVKIIDEKDFNNLFGGNYEN